MLRVVVCLGLLLFAPLGVRAQHTGGRAAAARVPAAAPPPRIAVLMLPTGELDPEMADALTELLIASVARRAEGVRIVGKEELQAQLGRSDAGTAECIESAACLGRVGVQLGVTEVIVGTIAQRSEADGALGWAFSLVRQQVSSGDVLGRVFREVTGDLDALLRALEESFPELYAVRVQPGRLVVRASILGAEVELDGAPIGRFEGVPLRRETVEPGAHVLRVRASGYRTLVREVEIDEGTTVVIEAALVRGDGWVASPWIYVGAGVGVASLVGGLALGASSQVSPDPSSSMRQVIGEFYPARELEATFANVLFGVAGAGAIVAVIGVLVSGEPEPATTAWFAPQPGGVVLGAEGRF